MNAFKYETHLHTCEGSACGTSHGKEYIEVYKKLGYAGIFVTDHFFGGNTAVPFDLIWEERVKLYCSGYEAALAEAEKSNKADGGNFQVFFGIEQTFDGDDYLIYGLDKAWLLKHPQVETMNHTELFNAVNMAGGLMIQAHPFRMRDYIQAIHIHPRDIHGVEIYNGGNKPEENQLAQMYAKTYDFPVTSGSDIHNVSCAPTMPNGNPIGGMEFETQLENVADYVKRIKNKEGKIIR